MNEYRVWCPKKGEKPEDARTVEAEDHEQAAEYDQEHQDNVHRGYDRPSSKNTLMVVGPTGGVYEVQVSGMMTTSYFGRDKVKVGELIVSLDKEEVVE